tara:strand:- start:489 stop:1262 length:774 start_codon:yes stop_codon:yes gene_type:complete
MNSNFKILAVLFTLFSISLDAQILSNGVTQSGYNNNNLFFDASTNYDPKITLDNNNGKGLLFPRTDLTNWTWLLDDMNNGGGATLPTAYDGMIVYNTGTGNTPSGGSNPTTSTAVTPGFYYFSNPNVNPDLFNPTITQGQWTPLGSGRTSVVEISEGSSAETNIVTANSTIEKVISLTGAADGTSTHIDLTETTDFPANTVVNFRKAIICDNSGNLLLVATGDYNTSTNTFVTGNGMMNVLLQAATDYKVELYYTSN